ncbi:MAG: D-2-hydroxyacid dehydrogenase [Oscillospiraceae bacterium]|nr:D-2-hydroxyacid dehydrogenase [Oscillospiraceae bacterium]
MNILVTAPFSETFRSSLRNEAEKYCCNIRFGTDSSDLSAADIIIGDITAKQAELCHNLRWLQITSAGADKYTYGSFLPENVILTNVTGAFGDGISEYIIGTILALFRGLFSYRQNQERCVWKDMKTERFISGSRALILGCGDIGSKTAVKLKSFGAQTVGIRKNIRPANGFDCIYDLKSLDSELPLADIVICCLPKTPLTDHLLDKRRIGLMKSCALIVNVGRGSLIDTAALTEALAEGHLSGAVLDVFEQEPLSAASPLWAMNNVLITPHISGPSFGHSPHTEKLITDICKENISRYMNGKPLINMIPPDHGYAYNCI